MDFTKGIFSLKQKAQMNQYTKTAQRYLKNAGAQKSESKWTIEGTGTGHQLTSNPHKNNSI